MNNNFNCMGKICFKFQFGIIYVVYVYLLKIKGF